MKFLGNPQGPHALAREWIGTRLAQWMGLPTFEMARIEYVGDPPIDGLAAQNGPAVAFRYRNGRPWDGSAEDLSIQNPGDLGGLVLLDTWLRNDDRYGPPKAYVALKTNVRNVYLADTSDPRRQLLVAMDFSDALRLRRGQSSALSRHIQGIEFYKDPTVFGVFPEFVPHLNASSLQPFLERLRDATASSIGPILREVPDAWDVSDAVRSAVESYLVDRAGYLHRNFSPNLSEEIRRQNEGCV